MLAGVTPDGELPPVPPTARSILDAIERIPAGKVMSYGDVAEFAGVSSARGVRRVMSRYGHEVPWHRVLHADGTAAPPVADRQLALLRAEGVPMRGGRVDMRLARWDGRAS